MKRRAHSSPVTPFLRFEVFRRDGPCVAPLVDEDAGPCSGRSTIEHVKTDLRLGVRASSDLEHCVSLCVGHGEGGMKAGHQWNTVKHNRERVRAYLIEVNRKRAAA